ncbi:hypothetical protein [Roseateles sp.]|jgi:hypothetical protein|uniref:hypothetical protein n=1 Tax=Roseateles sp. TaxID=1971397 RepID=UPI003BABF44A
MLYSRRFFVTALGAAPFASKGQPLVVCNSPSLGALSQRMGKAWLCMADAEVAVPARQVLAASQAAFEQQLVQLHQRPSSPEQAGGQRALARRYEDYQALLAGTPGTEAHRALLSTANEMMTLAQLANASRATQPWQARLASRQRLLSQRVALLALASPGAESIRRERQSAIYEFEAGMQALRNNGDAALRDGLAQADAAWVPLRDGASTGRAMPVFVASERLLAVMDAVTEHCARLG